MGTVCSLIRNKDTIYCKDCIHEDVCTVEKIPDNVDRRIKRIESGYYGRNIKIKENYKGVKDYDKRIL